MDSFTTARDALPLSICDIYDPCQHKTLEDLAWTVRTELDLVESGEDGTEDIKPAPLRRWLRKFAPNLVR